MNLLHTIGLMTRAEHERIVADNDEKAYEAWVKIAAERDDMKMYRDDWQQKHNAVVGKLKRAATDLAAQADRIRALNVELAKAGNLRGELKARAEKAEELLERALAREADLRPDAEAMRKKRAADRKRMAGKRNG